MATAIVADLRDHWTLYALMPIIAALIGYVTKLVAVEMMFRPLEFVGIPPYLGWQGVIPRYTPRMAATAVDLMMKRLLDPQEIIAGIDLDDLMRKMEQPMHEMVEQLTREVMTTLQPALWRAMPEAVQMLVIERVEAAIPDTLGRIVEDLRSNVDAVLDMRMLAINALTRDKALTVRLVKTIGSNEMRFIVRMGIPFGFGLGLVQAIAWATTHSPWIMPAFGGVTGLITDWLALQMIFRPLYPTKFLGLFTWQGLFIKRRKEVSRDYAELISREILTPANVFEALLTGPSSDRFLSLIHREIQAAIDTQSGPVPSVVRLAIGSRRYDEVRGDISNTVVQRMLERRNVLTDYAADAMNLPELLEQKMQLMTNEEFEGLLRPALKQDEWKLVSVGAILGFLIGELQLHLLLQ
ncbi:DUF445 family protein [Nocardia miyunensis]|uniref:DUF445 family protein n=1 Tax=Nocardia miyunensis TaxID=282684 RepID=UPI000830A146|nr:DUF445 family protein [Nocardia miyunensis]